jgi:hypothetical protein
VLRLENMDLARFQRALDAFDRANGEDPQHISVGAVARPRELVHAERLSAWVARLEPNASEPLALAARCQHIRRWQIPRDSYPLGRVGYLRWRTELARYERELIDAVRRINLKQNLHSNPDTQTMEDALCLEFLEFEFDDFSRKYSADKVIEIVQKTWKKMSPRGHSLALELPLSAPALALVTRALGA